MHWLCDALQIQYADGRDGRKRRAGLHSKPELLQLGSSAQAVQLELGLARIPLCNCLYVRMYACVGSCVYIYTYINKYIYLEKDKHSDCIFSLNLSVYSLSANQ